MKLNYSLIFLIHFLTFFAFIHMQVESNYGLKLIKIYRDLISDLNVPIKITANVCWDIGKTN